MTALDLCVCVCVEGGTVKRLMLAFKQKTNSRSNSVPDCKTQQETEHLICPPGELALHPLPDPGPPKALACFHGRN